MPRLVPTSARAVTANDNADLPRPNAFIYVGGAGNVKVDTVDGDTVTFNGLSAGDVIPVPVDRVYSTGTTATNLLAMW